MSVTLTTNYKEILKPETVARIDKFLEERFDLDSMLQFIDEYSEENFIPYYEDYVDTGEQFEFEAVDLFLKNGGSFEDIYCDTFERKYLGKFDSPGEMAEHMFGDDVHAVIVVDWEATADIYIGNTVNRLGDHYFLLY